MEIENPGYYAIIPANVRYAKGLKPNAKLLYGEITALANKTGECYASNAYFADLYDVTEKAVKAWIKQLEDHGFIYRRVEDDNKRFISILDKKVPGGVPKSTGGEVPKGTHNNTVINNTTNNNIDTNINISKQSLPGEQTTPASIQDNSIGIDVPKVYGDNSINDFLDNFTQQCKKLDIPYRPRGVQERRYAKFIMSKKRERETAGIGGTLEHKIYKLLYIYSIGKKDIKMPIITSVVDIYYKWPKIMNFAYLRKDNKPLYQDFVAINKQQNIPKTFNINQMP